ncbi:MAG: GGDEF domain-containing protein [Lachnospiraceae bacterium]|nr:GGDEF domain-containing protein [Lachnospiraceae bacterium]
MEKYDKKISIGALVGNVHSPHTVDLLHGMEEAASQYDVNVFYFLGTHSSHLLEYLFGRDTKADYDYQFNTIYDYACLANLDALIIAYGSLCIFLENTSKEEFLARFRKIPYLMIEDFEDQNGGNCLLTDNVGGMTQLVEHLLIDHGFTRLAFIGGPPGNRDGDQRLDTTRKLCAQYHVPLPEDAIEYGNFSQNVSEQTNALLDRYPDLQAIICANDEMAIGVCKICTERGLVVGRDIAVTGFDNNWNAQLAKVPLTTVKQTGFEMGYQALLNALKLSRGEKVGETLIPTKFVRRGSCGCRMDSLSGTVFNCDDIENCDPAVIGYAMTKSIIETEYNKEMFDYCVTLTTQMAQGGLTVARAETRDSVHDGRNLILDALEKLNKGRMQNYISRPTLNRENVDWMRYLATKTDTSFVQAQIYRTLSDIQSRRWGVSLFESGRDMNEVLCKSWAVQMIAREMAERVDSTEEFFQSALSDLKMFGVRSSYIYLLEDVVIHRSQDVRYAPDRLYLAAWYSGDEVVSYKDDERPIVTAENGFPRYLKEQGKQLFSFILFSDERQYGVLICEINSKDVAIMYFISLQIGTAMRFLELHNKEVETRYQLQESLKTIQAQNMLLSFISEMDELTNIYNRKGFMERALKMNQDEKHIGKKAVLFFADLDHLKEINDVFGHTEGDYALENAAYILKKVCPPTFVIGRLGGDEFVALGMIDTDGNGAILEPLIRNAFYEFNQASSKPFFVEISFGYYEFTLGVEPDFSLILEKADERLYQDKKGRRHSISKSKN